MSLQEELRELPGLVSFADGEELQAAIFGTVSGPGIDGREGILFVTQNRVGLSVAEGLFQGAARTWAVFADVKTAYAWNSRSQFCVDVMSGSYNVQPSDATHDPEAVIAYINRHRRDFVPSDLEEVAAKGGDQLQAGDLNAASDCAAKLLERDSQLRPALALQMRIHEASGEPELALETCRQFLATEPDDASEARGWEADYLRRLGRLEEAVAAATTSIRSRPSAFVLVTRAWLNLELHRNEAAIADAHAAADLEPEDWGVWDHLAEIALHSAARDDVPKCIDNLERLHQPRAAQRIRALLASAEDRFADTVDLCARLLEEDPNDETLVKAFLGAAADGASDVGADWLPRLDSIFGGEPWYEVYAALVLLAGKRNGDALTRWLSIPDEQRTVLGPGLNALVRCASAIEAGQPAAAVELAQGALASKAWVTEEYLEYVAANVAFLGAKAALMLGERGLALEWLRQAESISDKERLWTAEEMACLIKEAHAEIPTALRVDHEGAASGLVPTYQLLGSLIERLDGAGNLQEWAARARELHAHFDQPPLVSVMGEYSVGKSTFINALIGRGLLPTGEGVTTGTIVWLRYDQTEHVRIVFRDGRVTEHDTILSVDDAIREVGEGRTARDVRYVEVFLPAPVLRRINIVDTPGLNAPFAEHQDTTEAFLSASDAVIFLFNVENTGKATEATFLRRLEEHSRKAVAVVNQIDLVPPDEVEEVLEGVAYDFPGAFQKVMGVSALRGLRGLLSEDDEAVRRSRLPALRAWLEDHLLAGARRLKDEATREKIGEVLAEVGQEHARFDQRVDEDLQAIARVGTTVREWAERALADAIQDGMARASWEISGAVDGLVQSIAGASRPERLVELPAIQGYSQTLLLAVREAWKLLSDRLVTAYDEQTAPAITTLESLAEEWQGVLDRTLVEISVELRAWRKDLLDYLEQSERFAEGYFEAQGVGSALLLELDEGMYGSAQSIREVLDGDLRFLTSRPEEAGKRWRRELTSNFKERFSRLDRELRAAAADVRNRSFRSVEALGAMV